MDNVNFTTEASTTPEADYFLKYFVPTEWSLKAELVIVMTVFILGVPGNALIVTVQYKNKTKTSTDYLVMVMAMYEFFGSLVNTLFRGARDIHPVWIATSSTFYCKFQPFAYFLSQYGSGETLGVLAVDRCIRTMFPLARWYSEKHAKIISLCIFIFTLALTIPNIILESWDPISLQCAIYMSDLRIMQYIGQAGSIMMLAIFCTMSMSYLLIAMFLKRRHIRKLRQRRVHHRVDVDSARPHTNAPDETTTSEKEETSTAPTQTVNGARTISTTVAPTMSSNDNGQSVSKPDAKSSNDVTSGVPNSGANTGSKMLTLEGRNVNKLTALMFTISVIYVASYLVLWYLYMTAPDALGSGVLQLAYSIPMLNCISNPVMLFSMSSRFRQNVMTLFKPRTQP